MKKKILGRIVFISAFVSILIFSGFLFLNNINQSSAAGECFPESEVGAGDGFCMGITWNPSQVDWHKDVSTISFTAYPAITPEPTEAEKRDYNLFPTSCTTGSNYGDTCGPICYSYKRGAQICRRSPINRFDNLPPVCGSWTRSGNIFTLSGSTDAPASGNSGSSGIQVAGGTCTASAGGTCTVDIYDVAANKTTCTSPVNPAAYSCYGSIPTNASLCSGDDSGLAESTLSNLVPACTAPNKCEFTCNAGYQYQMGLNGFESCVPIGPVQTPLSCSPRSQSISVGAGVRYEATGGDGNYNWSAPASCFGEVEAANPKVFWPRCNTPGNYWIDVTDNSGHSDSCMMEVVGSLDCTVDPVSATVARGGSAGFSVSSNFPSTSGNQIYVSVSGLASGLSSSLYIGTIPVGSDSLGFGISATAQAALGTSDFTVSCSMDCPVGGCPSGGSPSNIDGNPVEITVVDGTPPASCNYNRIQDNGETGVDCGGGNCPVCGAPPACGPYWETNPHYVCENYACARVDACGSNLDGCTSGIVGHECGDQGTGTVNVTSNSPAARWTVSTPQGSLSGNGLYRSYSGPEVPAPGTYTVISNKTGCVVGSPDSQFLLEGQVIDFFIDCDGDDPPLPTCWISAVPDSQTANIGSNASFTATTTCSDGSIPSDNINLTDWSVNKSASFVSGENNSKTTTLRCDSSTGGVPATVTPTLGSLIPISSSLTCNPVLACSPVNQTVDVNENASFSAAGGSTYSWTATGGSPASGLGASFAAKYATAGNKTVTVSSDGNNTSCSVNVVQPKHNECVMVNGAPACSLIDGRAPDRCNTVADCGGGSCNYNGSQDNGETGVDCGGGGCPSCGGNPPLKYSCGSGSCQVDSAGPYTDSTCGGVCSPTYYSCSNGSCSADANGQFTSADCNNMCVAPIHSECNGPACVNVFGPGNNSCTVDNPDCGVATTITHLGCIGNACVILNGVGSNECGAVGEACVTGGGGKCSLKAAPPLVSGGQSVKLTWQCTGSPTCSITRKYNNSNTTVTVQDPAVRTSGNFSDKPLSSGLYTLKCNIPAADATASVKVSTLIECAPTDPTCKP